MTTSSNYYLFIELLKNNSIKNLTSRPSSNNLKLSVNFIKMSYNYYGYNPYYEYSRQYNNLPIQNCVQQFKIAEINNIAPNVNVQKNNPSLCQKVTYINSIDTSTAIVSGGVPIPIGTVIIYGTTTIPSNTVTVITGYTGIPTNNSDFITVNKGFFSFKEKGRYLIETFNCFGTASTVASTDYRAMYIYRVNYITGLITLLAVDSRTPILNLPTCINLFTDINLDAGDQIFVAATQLTSTGETISTIAKIGRIAITKIC